MGEATPTRRVTPVCANPVPVVREGAVGRNGKQASASKILLSWARGLFGGGDTSKAAPPGIEPVNPLWSSRFLLMQTHVGYRLA